jgi:hypothetical protein
MHRTKYNKNGNLAKIPEAVSVRLSHQLFCESLDIQSHIAPRVTNSNKGNGKTVRRIGSVAGRGEAKSLRKSSMSDTQPAMGKSSSRMRSRAPVTRERAGENDTGVSTSPRPGKTNRSRWRARTNGDGRSDLQPDEEQQKQELDMSPTAAISSLLTDAPRHPRLAVFDMIFGSLPKPQSRELRRQNKKRSSAAITSAVSDAKPGNSESSSSIRVKASSDRQDFDTSIRKSVKRQRLESHSQNDVDDDSADEIISIEEELVLAEDDDEDNPDDSSLDYEIMEMEPACSARSKSNKLNSTRIAADLLDLSRELNQDLCTAADHPSADNVDRITDTVTEATSILKFGVRRLLQWFSIE